MINLNQSFDFYDKTNLKSYNLDDRMQYQLRCLDSLDVFTRKHCENVANLTCRICEYLHDIGKVFIPPEVLQKPGKLTDEEYQIMKSHTTIGYDICMKDEKLRPYAAGTIYHHEALNGSGYPKGLVKKDIPYEGQIIRVADEYDAITSKRQYKSHIDISDTLQILIDNTKPNEKVASSDALGEMAEFAKMGKDNPLIVKALFKVVLDDINYEIYCSQKYVDSLKSELKRFEQMDKYEEKMEKAKKEKDKQYYLEGIKALLGYKETLENYKQIKADYEKAYDYRKKAIDKLYDEIKKIKKLKL